MLNTFTIQFMNEAEIPSRFAPATDAPAPSNALSDVFTQVCGLIGWHAALRLSRSVGGQRVYVPKEIRDDHRLFALGPDVCAWLTDRYGGRVVEFPIGPASRRELEANRIAELSRQGLSANQIAEQVGVTVRTIYQHRRRERSRQLASEDEPGQ